MRTSPPEVQAKYWQQQAGAWASAIAKVYLAVTGCSLPEHSSPDGIADVLIGEYSARTGGNDDTTESNTRTT